MSRPVPLTTGSTWEPPSSRAATVGVEEEFLVVGRGRGRPVAAAGEVLDEAASGPELPGGTSLKHELLAVQVEAASGICTQLGELARQLSAGRRRLAAAARRKGLLLLSSGTPVCTGAGGQFTPGVRYEQIADVYAGVVADYEACGCHVHVGVPDRETAVAVVNRLRPWLPSLLALSVNSPFHQGRDTGYGSWRMVLQSRFPGSGVTPYFPDAAAYDGQLERLVECGTLADVRQSFWLARPSPCFPTVELRVADAAATVEEAVLQAALSRGLVRTALTDIARGREPLPVPDQIAAAALWTAARYGLSGPGVHPRTQRKTPAVDLVHELLAHVSPALEETGDLRCVRRLLSAVLSRGTGADRQRAVAGGGPEAVVALLAAETERPPGAQCGAPPGPPAGPPPGPPADAGEPAALPGTLRPLRRRTP